MLSDVFTDIALSISGAFGGPYFEARVVIPGAAVMDSGGSIVTPAAASYRPCQAQVDDVTEAMRSEAGYADRDVRLLILGVDALDTDQSIEVLKGPNAGRWSVQSCSRDPAGIGWVARGRRG